uniref:Uncharacterized protein n=1 Tax=Siphoviridae sp. ctr2f5 TaxID=2825684 RepID=A0A8S5QE59_9CAUD|nr:MAG TPA: hypothetical protein [Siphoviridae sp. ctr2f5]
MSVQFIKSPNIYTCFTSFVNRITIRITSN